jgi:hypothetical protein
MLSQDQQALLEKEKAVMQLKQREERFMYYGIYES